MTLHHVLVRVATETSRHAGHADLVRELIDGALGLTASRPNLPPGDHPWWQAHHDRVERSARQAAPPQASQDPCRGANVPVLLVRHIDPIRPDPELPRPLRWRVTVIGVPYHLDEYLPDLDLTPEPAELIIPELPAGEIWSRLAVLYTAVARAVTRGRVEGGRLDPPVVTYLDQAPIRRPQVTGLSAAELPDGPLYRRTSTST